MYLASPGKESSIYKKQRPDCGLCLLEQTKVRPLDDGP